jgi:hypothetical protein
MRKSKRKAVLFCACGQVLYGAAWGVPSTTLAAFLKNLSNQQATIVEFVKASCPDCFERNKLGEYYQQGETI